METNDSLAIQVSPNDGYELSKMNAMQHGVLTKQAILEWESSDDYEQLKNSFFVEYCPTTATEIHLVEELINIVWRKKRIQRAENVELKKRLTEVLFPSSLSWVEKPIVKMVTLEKNASLREMTTNDVFSLNESTLKEAISEYQNIVKKIESLRILRNKRIEENNPIKYAELLEMVDEDIQKDWSGWIGGEKDGKIYRECEASLYRWLGDYIQFWEKKIIEMEFKKKHLKQLKDVYIGLGYSSLLENTTLMRYEVHLDRKFEKTLAMLLKFREISRQNNGTLEVDK
jgi:hypothetical protein